MFKRPRALLDAVVVSALVERPFRLVELRCHARVIRQRRGECQFEEPKPVVAETRQNVAKPCRLFDLDSYGIDMRCPEGEYLREHPELDVPWCCLATLSRPHLVVGLHSGNDRIDAQIELRISVIPYTQFGVFEREVSEAA